MPRGINQGGGGEGEGAPPHGPWDTPSRTKVRADYTQFYSIQPEIFSGQLSGVRARSQHKKQSSGVHKIAVTLGHPVLSLEITLRMLMAFTYLPGFVTVVFRGM